MENVESLLSCSTSAMTLLSSSPSETSSSSSLHKSKHHFHTLPLLLHGLNQNKEELCTLWRLFCFPPAGATFHKFKPFSFPHTELFAYQSPHPIVPIPTIMARLVDELLPLLDKPYTLWGHSAGSILTLSLVDALLTRGLPLPHRIILSGCSIPKIPKKLVVYSLQEMESWGGFPTNDNDDDFDDIVDEMKRNIQSELSNIDTFLMSHIWDNAFSSLPVHLSIFNGKDDVVQTSCTIEWKEWMGKNNTDSSSVDVTTLPGSHFFPFERDEMNMELTSLLSQDLNEQKACDRVLQRGWNNRKMEYPETLCLHNLFQKAVELTPNDVAIVYQETTLTFVQLDKTTDLLARYLYNMGVRPDSIVGIFMEHCIEYVISYIAIHKAGGAYMPLELVYPPELLSSVLQTSSPVLVLTKLQHASKLPSSMKRYELDGNWSHTLSTLSSEYGTNFQIHPTPDSLGFVVMSSGTTGVPKGICVPHRAAVHSYYWRLQKYPFTPVDKVACHVFFVWELLRPLCGNVPLYIIPDDIIYDPPCLIHYLQQNEITRILFTPSLLQLILDTISCDITLPHLALVWLCGEVVTVCNILTE